MTDNKILPNRTVLVQGDRIIDIALAPTFELPENAKVIAGNGGYLMPGIADMHIHTYDNWNAWPTSPLKLYSYLSMEDFQIATTTAKQADMHTAGHIPMQIGLDETLSGGMGEIAHIEELAWDLFYYDKRKKIKGVMAAGRWYDKPALEDMIH